MTSMPSSIASSTTATMRSTIFPPTSGSTWCGVKREIIRGWPPAAVEASRRAVAHRSAASSSAWGSTGSCWSRRVSRATPNTSNSPSRRPPNPNPSIAWSDDATGGSPPPRTFHVVVHTESGMEPEIVANGIQPPTRSPKVSAMRSVQRGHHEPSASSSSIPPSFANHFGTPLSYRVAHTRMPTASAASSMFSYRSTQAPENSPGFGWSRAQSNVRRRSSTPESASRARSSGQRL